MRFERRGGPPNLTAAFTDFITVQMKGRSLDENRNAEAIEGKFPDFSLFNELALVEMKTLEVDQHERLNETLNDKIAKDEMPIFYGSRDIRTIYPKLSNASEVHRALESKLARTIESILRKANKQFKSYRERHPRKTAINVCTILNSEIMEFTPELVLLSINSKMKGRDGELSTRFPFIDCVIYISEKHATILPDGRLGLAMGSFYGPSMEQAPWRDLVVEYIMQKWSEFRTGSDVNYAELRSVEFDVVEDIPEKAPRHEFWRIEYAQKPYFRKYSNRRLKLAWNRCIAQSMLTSVLGSWEKPPPDHFMKCMRVFTHLIEEINERGLDLRELSPQTLTPDERAYVLRELPTELADKFPRASE